MKWVKQIIKNFGKHIVIISLLDGFGAWLYLAYESLFEISATAITGWCGLSLITDLIIIFIVSMNHREWFFKDE